MSDALLLPEEELGHWGRVASVRAGSINAEDRTFQAIATTEQRAQVIDWSAYELIDEIILADGVRFADHVPLMTDHQSHTARANIGHVQAKQRKDDEWLTRAQISEPANERDPAAVYWVRVRDGHQRGVSIGYSVDEYTDIAPGKSATVGGRAFTAEARRLRISTAIRIYELSLVGVGADSRALIQRCKSRRSPQQARRLFRGHVAQTKFSRSRNL